MGINIIDDTPTKTSAIGNGIAAVTVSMFPIPVVAGIYTGIMQGFAEAIVAFFALSFWVLITSVFTAALVGTPIYLLLRAIKCNNWVVVVLTGGVVGAAVGIWLFPYGSKPHIGAAFGFIGAYAGAAYKYGAELDLRE